MCDPRALENDSAGNEVAHAKSGPEVRGAVRAELSEGRARRAASEARDAAYARSLQRDSARARREAAEA